MLGMNIFGPLLILKSKTEYTLALALPMFYLVPKAAVNGAWLWHFAVLTSILPFIFIHHLPKYILNTFIQSGVKG